MAITGTSTQAEIVTEYLNNVNYDVNGSAGECKLFIAACRALLVMHPANWQHAGSTIQYNPQLWETQLNDAKTWLAANGTGSQSDGGVSHLAFRGDWR